LDGIGRVVFACGGESCLGIVRRLSCPDRALLASYNRWRGHSAHLCDGLAAHPLATFYQMAGDDSVGRRAGAFVAVQVFYGADVCHGTCLDIDTQVEMGGVESASLELGKDDCCFSSGSLCCVGRLFLSYLTPEYSRWDTDCELSALE